MRQEFESGNVIGSTRTPGAAPHVTETTDVSDARNAAFSQIARFRGILESSSTATTDDCRKDLAALMELQKEMPATLSRLEQAAEIGDTTLVAALRDALAELKPLQQEVHQRITGFGSAASSAMEDLASFREELAERAARRELGESLVSTTPPVLEIPILVFGIGWLSFTTFHASLMIGGMFKAVGPPAFFLLAFYSMFYLVGFGMLAGGLASFRKEWLALSGKDLTMRYNLWGYSWEKRYTLDKRSRAWVTTPGVQTRGATNQEIAILVGDGKELRMGNGLPSPLLHEEATRINEYIRSIFPSSQK